MSLNYEKINKLKQSGSEINIIRLEAGKGRLEVNYGKA